MGEAREITAMLLAYGYDDDPPFALSSAVAEALASVLVELRDVDGIPLTAKNVGTIFTPDVELRPGGPFSAWAVKLKERAPFMYNHLDGGGGFFGISRPESRMAFEATFNAAARRYSTVQATNEIRIGFESGPSDYQGDPVALPHPSRQKPGAL